jgi:hypothetical protein
MRDDLDQLGDWASRKRLKGPHQRYTYLVQEVEATLAIQRLRFPRSARLAHFLYRVNLLVSPKSVAYELGRVAHYRSPKSR